MSKFNRKQPAPAPVSAMRAEPALTTRSHEGAPTYALDDRSELFTLATGGFLFEKTFYETAEARADRFRALVRQLAVQDFDWLSGMLTWLRGPDANIRTASLVGAAEAVHERLSNGQFEGNHQLIAAVCQRADEPGELLAYWKHRFQPTGRSNAKAMHLPKPIKRGIAAAAQRLYDERSFLKYDSKQKAVRMADVLELAHVQPRAEFQSLLFPTIIDVRHNRDKEIPDALTTLVNHKRLTAMPVAERRAMLDVPDFADQLKAAGFTWEDLGQWLQGEITARAWEAIIPSMGYMAALRNLRNFDNARISNKTAAAVAARLADPANVERSRQLPFRFLSAHVNTHTMRWANALEEALNYSLRNVPELPGRSLVLIDTSGSMLSPLSGDPSSGRPDQQRHGATAPVRPMMVEVAALFGIALATRGESDVYGWAHGQFHHRVKVGDSVLRQMEAFTGRVGSVGHSTMMIEAVKATYDRTKHNRVIIISDMQLAGYGGTESLDKMIAKNTPLYLYNLNGYNTTPAPTGRPNRHQLGGLSDATFRQILNLEAGQQGRWPWEDFTH